MGVRKMPPAKVIKEHFEGGGSQKELAAKYDMSEAAVSEFLARTMPDLRRRTKSNTLNASHRRLPDKNILLDRIMFEGVKQSQIAAEYGVSKQAVYALMNRERLVKAEHILRLHLFADASSDHAWALEVSVDGAPFKRTVFKEPSGMSSVAQSNAKRFVLRHADGKMLEQWTWGNHAWRYALVREA